MKNGLRAFDSGGVLEKFPNLRVAFLEGNCAWLPWLLYRLDERAKLHGPWRTCPCRGSRANISSGNALSRWTRMNISSAT
jgi:hypothetical protein